MDLHVDTTGHGPPLVLLHGWAMHSGVFSALAERLREAHTLYLVDLPGHGYSRASRLPLAPEPVTRALLDTLPPAIWLGWSLGGLFALHAAALSPNPSPINGRGEQDPLSHTRPCPLPQAGEGDKVLACGQRFPFGERGWGEGARHAKIPALIMLCSTPCFVHQADWPHGMPADTFQTFAVGLHGDYKRTLDRFIALETLGSAHAKDELRTLRELLYARGEPTRHALTDGLNLLQTLDLRPILPTLNIPTLWLSARRDRLVNPRAMQAAAALTPNAHCATLENAGHAPMLTHADTLAAHLLRFTANLQ